MGLWNTKVAEREGFEPSVPLLTEHTISSRAPSASSGISPQRTPSRDGKEQWNLRTLYRSAELAERVGFEPTCPALHRTSRFRVDPVTATSVPLRIPGGCFSAVAEKTGQGVAHIPRFAPHPKPQHYAGNTRALSSPQHHRQLPPWDPRLQRPPHPPVPGSKLQDTWDRAPGSRRELYLKVGSYAARPTHAEGPPFPHGPSHPLESP